MKQLISYLVWLGGAVLVPLQLFAQTDRQPSRADSLLFRDYAFLKQSDPWLTSPNAAGLQRLTVGHLSQATLSLQYDKGHFTNYYGAPKALTAAAGVESFYRLSPDIVIFGKIAYRNEALKNLTGSAFVNPTRMPFDIVEDSLTNAGDKHLDTYQLTGAVSGRVYKKVSLGVKVDFTAANYAKYKDLRHKNNLMNLVVTAGLYVPVANWLTVGAHYEYLRHTESVVFKKYGASDQVYKSLVSYGAFIGKVETFGAYGYTDMNQEMPFFDEHHGGGIQLDFQLTPQISWYHAFAFNRRKGYYGKKSPYTISYNQHKSNGYEYLTRLTWRQRQNVHQWQFAIETEKLQDFANTYREMTDEETSAHYYAYYSPVKLSDKLWTTGQVAYSGRFGLKNQVPVWAVQAGMNFMFRRQTAYEYPYFRRQEIRSYEEWVQAEYNLFLPKGILTVGAGFAYRNGRGSLCEDGTFAAPSAKQSFPPEMEAFLHREYQYLTAPRYQVDGSVKYGFIFPNTRMKTFAKINISHQKAHCNDVLMEGNDRLSGTLTIGCEF